MMTKPSRPLPGATGEQVEDYGRNYYLGVIAGAAALSVAGNVIAFGVEELPFKVALFIHAIPPVIAVLMIHMVATIRTSFMGSIRRDPLMRSTTRAWPPLPGVFQRVKRWFRSWSYGDLILATVLVTLTSVTLVVTLGVSAVSLAAVGEMAGWEGRVSWALPLMLDLPALIATLGFIKARHRMGEDARAAAVEDDAHSDADNAVTDRGMTPVTDEVVARHDDRDAFAATARTERRNGHDGRAEVPFMTEIPAVVNERHDGPRHAADQPRRSVMTDREPVTDAVAEPVTPRDVEPVTPVVTDDDAPVTVPVTADHDVMTDADEEAFMRLMTESLTPVTEAVTEAATDDDAPVTEPVTEPVTVEPSEGLGLRDLAELVHAETNPQASVGDVAAVLQERQGGASYKAAGAVAEVSEATARRWVTAAERLGGQPLARR